MPRRIPTHKPRHAPQSDRERSRERRVNEVAQRLYQTRQWKRLRLQVLAEHPLCVMCLDRDKRVVPATVVDHIIPHGGDLSLFWDMDNLQSLCASCHSGRKRREERAPRA